MTIQERIDCLVEAGEKLKSRKENPEIEKAFLQAHVNNKWFTIKNIELATDSIVAQYLAHNKLSEWLSKYELSSELKSKNIGLILAGNIPYVGIHDVITTFLSGHIAHVKYSEKDSYLIPLLVRLMQEVNPEVEQFIHKTEMVKNMDAVITTGSDNSARYFEYYFRNTPHIIRKNRNSIAILDGEESEQDLQQLGIDIFTYFGLGCRNVSKIYIPRDYDIKKVLAALDSFNELNDHNKYKNNYDYNYAIYILNKIEFLMNAFLIVKEDKSIHSRIACLHYEYYDDLDKLISEIKEQEEQIQCYLSRQSLSTIKYTPLGKSQEPELWDYADGIDTMQFLLNLKDEL